ncbi:MAG: non-homologous end-joining DNA ligase, partial [Candidatus Eremiobacteraeota bacterium]|nr:non-homologous end-joining DNA ligase [Candidatus Eremiobacteraeota bacterium]
MATKAKHTIDVDGREVSLSNLDKVLWPRDGYTKGDLISYYAKISAYILPHLRDRPLTLQRYPDGIDGESFFEKQKPRFTPSWIPSHADSAYSKTRTVEYMLCNDDATLIWCANLAAIVLHVWYSHAQTPDKPDFALFDLDPGERCTLKTLTSVAVAFREALDGIGACPLIKTSGGYGLHVIVPLEPRYDYDPVKDFAQLVARHIEEQVPELTTLERTIARRPQDRVYLDWLQVGKGKTV